MFVQCKPRFKRRATAVLNSIDRIEFDLSTTFETNQAMKSREVNLPSVPLYLVSDELSSNRKDIDNMFPPIDFGFFLGDSANSLFIQRNNRAFT